MKTRLQGSAYFVSSQAQCMILPLWCAGRDTKEIARALGFPECVIAVQLPRLLERRRADRNQNVAIGDDMAAWTKERDEFLTAHLEKKSASEIARALNEEFATSYTRCAVLGRVKRLGLSSPAGVRRSPAEVAVRQRQWNKRKNDERKKKRWAANPSLEQRAARMKEKKANREIMLTRGAKRTSPQYRTHLPRAPEMSKSELRRMLADAVRHTASLEVA